MADKLYEMLSALGLEPGEENRSLVEMAAERAKRRVCAMAGVDVFSGDMSGDISGKISEKFASDMESVCLDMAVGEYLMSRLALFPQDFAEWQPDVKSLGMGDVSISYAVDGDGVCGGRAGVFAFANELLQRSEKTVMAMLAASRGVRW